MKGFNAEYGVRGISRHSIFCILVAICLLTAASCVPQQPSLTLGLLGDISLARGVRASPDSFSTLAPDLRSADLILANLESPLADAKPPAASSGYDLCAMASVAAVLPAWNIDLFSIANNHRFDCGADGPHETDAALSKLGLAAVGPDPKLVFHQFGRLKLAFLAFDDVLSPLDETAAAQAILSARENGALVIVSVHWGMEYQGGPSTRQLELAQQFSNAGAALVVGTHPHVLQPAAWVSPSVGIEPGTLDTGTHGTLVLYSLGNALFDQPGLADTRRSALVLVTIDPKGVKSTRVVPFVIDLLTSRVELATAEDAQRIQDEIGLPVSDR